MFADMRSQTHRRLIVAVAAAAVAAITLFATSPVDSVTTLHTPAVARDAAVDSVPQAPPAVPVPAPTTTTTTAPTTSTTAPPTTTTSPPTTTTAPPPPPPTTTTPPPAPVGPVPQLSWDRASTCDFAVSGDTPGLWPVLNELTAITGIRFHSGPADPANSGIVVLNEPVPGIPSADGAMNPHITGNTFHGGTLRVTARSTGDLTLLRHEMGHGFGLDHNPGTVMDARASASRQHPDWNASETAALAAFGQRTGCR